MPDQQHLEAPVPENPQIIISPTQLRTAMRVRWMHISAIAALASLCVAGLLWLFTSHVIVNTVRHDVRRASVFNCERTNRAATAGKAVQEFLDSDALLNKKLGNLDRQTASANKDLGREIAQLGELIPIGISLTFLKLQNLYQDIADLRVRAARLWSGETTKPTKGHKAKTSLSSQVLLVAQAPCDKILSP